MFGARLGRREVQRLQLGPDVAVDEVLLRQLRVDIVRHRIGMRDRDDADRDVPEVARHHRRVADNRTGRQQPGLIHTDERRFVREIRRQSGDIARRAIVVLRGDAQLLLRLLRQNAVGRFNRDAGEPDVARAASLGVFSFGFRLTLDLNCRVGRRGNAQAGSPSYGMARHSGGDPVVEDAVLGRAAFEPLAAAVRKLANRLEQQQAAFGGGTEHAPASPFLGECVVIEVRIEPEQTQLKAVLPALLAVTRSGIARVAAENRLHVPLEIDRRRRRHVFDHDRHGHGLTAQFDAQRSSSVRERLEEPRRRDLDNANRFERVGRIPRHVGRGGGDEKLARGETAIEADVTRSNKQLGQARLRPTHHDPNHSHDRQQVR